jgi:hypothetical protein
MEQLDQAALHVGLEVHHHVAAGDEIELGERRIRL